MDILVINYLEKSFVQTLKCVERLDGNVIMQDRTPRGVGSLAAAINQGFSKVQSEYFLVITNCTFDADQINVFTKCNKGFIAIQPTYLSDHRFLRKPKSAIFPGYYGWRKVPFTEFTFVLLESKSFDQLNGVDEKMPYVGFDIDFGLRANKIGAVAINYDYDIGHVYNRYMSYDRITYERRRLRRMYEASTLKRLRQLYGDDVKEKLTRHEWGQYVNQENKQTV